MPMHVFKKLHFEFAIVTAYVDDMNLIGTLKELEKAALHMKSNFKMKNLEKKLNFVLAWSSGIV